MDGRGFLDVLGDVLSGDMAEEAKRLENDRRAREALRRQHDALKQVKTLTASDLLAGVMSEGAQVANELRGPPKETKHAEPVKPVVSAFPPPPSSR